MRQVAGVSRHRKFWFLPNTDTFGRRTCSFGVEVGLDQHRPGAQRRRDRREPRSHPVARERDRLARQDARGQRGLAGRVHEDRERHRLADVQRQRVGVVRAGDVGVVDRRRRRHAGDAARTARAGRGCARRRPRRRRSPCRRGGSASSRRRRRSRARRRRCASARRSAPGRRSAPPPARPRPTPPRAAGRRGRCRRAASARGAAARARPRSAGRPGRRRARCRARRTCRRSTASCRSRAAAPTARTPAVVRRERRARAGRGVGRHEAGGEAAERLLRRREAVLRAGVGGPSRPGGDLPHHAAADRPRAAARRPAQPSTPKTSRLSSRWSGSTKPATGLTCSVGSIWSTRASTPSAPDGRRRRRRAGTASAPGAAGAAAWPSAPGAPSSVARVGVATASRAGTSSVRPNASSRRARVSVDAAGEQRVRRAPPAPGWSTVAPSPGRRRPSRHRQAEQLRAHAVERGGHDVELVAPPRRASR